MTTSIPLNDEQRARTMSREDASHPHPHALPEPHAVLGLKEAVAIIVGIVIVIFGANRLPELGRGLGKGIKNFKDATKEMSEKSEKSETDS